MAQVVKNDVDTEQTVKVFVAVRGMVNHKCLRALMDSRSVSAINFSECSYCAN